MFATKKLGYHMGVFIRPSREHTHYGSAEPVGAARKRQQMDSAWINTVYYQGSTVTSSECCIYLKESTFTSLASVVHPV